MVWSNVFPHSQRATSQTVEGPNPWCQTREITTTSEGRKGVRIKCKLENSPKYKCAGRDLNLRHRFAQQMEITRTIHYAVAPSSKKRRLNDGLRAHAIRSTRESSGDVTRTLDARPSKVRSDSFPAPEEQSSYQGS